MLYPNHCRSKMKHEIWFDNKFVELHSTRKSLVQEFPPNSLQDSKVQDIVISFLGKLWLISI